MNPETELQALDERFAPARAAYRSLRYEGAAPRPGALARKRGRSRWLAALAVPAAAVVVMMVMSTREPGVAPVQPSLNSAVAGRPLSWQSALPEQRLAVVPPSGNLSFSPPPRPQRANGAVLLEDTSAPSRAIPVVG